MDYSNNPARLLLIQQINCADTLAEVHAAQDALRLWRHQHPEDLGIWDAGEELSLLEDALLEDDSPPGKSPSWTVWQQLEYEVMGAQTLPAIAAARHALHQWAERHPGETAPDLLESLFFLLDVVEDEQSGKRSSLGQSARELVSQAI